MRRLISLVAASLLAGPALADDAIDVRLPNGFKIALYADETLANDIQAMTLDRQGRVVVTGPGYVKTLHGDPKLGRATHASTFATPKSGGMGLCFDGNDLLITADNSLSRYRDANADGVTDGPPEHILPLATAEHGGHAIRKGPDGSFYVIGGNDAGIDARHVSSKLSPIQRPEAGAIVCLSPDLKTSEVIAHGFRNPYDFDFNSRGDLFAYDSDCERDEFLPWSTPTRLFHVAIGGHHGWRLKGYTRSFARRPDLFDTIGPVVDLGRGSPTGVVCYRHTQFPEHYRDGLFLLDWTFGKIHFLPLKSTPGGYSASPETFLEPVGNAGFAPTDVCVAPDGSLLVSIGGRKTRGAVYRIWHEGSAAKGTDLVEVLDAPQPLDAWSRERWIPLARGLGRGSFVRALREGVLSDAARIRAVEVLVELFDGPNLTEVESAWESASHPLRARLAWSLARRRAPLERPARLSNGPSDLAVEVELLELAASGRLADTVDRLPTSLALASPRIIPPIERALRTISADEKARIGVSIDRVNGVSTLNFALANFHIEPNRENGDRAIRAALRVLNALDRLEESVPEVVNRLNAVRLIMVALGDWKLDQAEADVFSPYTLTGPLDGRDGLIEESLKTVRRLIPSSSIRLVEEATRLLAMLHDPAPSTRLGVLGSITEASRATNDLHALIVLDRLASPLAPGDANAMAKALCLLDLKLGGKPGRIKQSWNLRVGELVASLSKRHPMLVDALISRPDFAQTGHVEWASQVAPDSRIKVARAFFSAALADHEGRVPIDETVLKLWDSLPRDEVLAAIRSRPDWPSTSAGLLTRLAETPIETDRTRFVTALDSRDKTALVAAVTGLGNLAPEQDPKAAIPLFSLLRRLITDPTAAPLRREVANLIARDTGLDKPLPEPSVPTELARHYAPLYRGFNAKHPRFASGNEVPRDADPTAWKTSLANVDIQGGSARRGAELFKTYQCASCHTGAVLGPDLSGVSRRLSLDNLFTSILDPTRDVAPAYRVTVVETRDGRTHTGFVVFESAEGLIFQTGPTAIERIPTADIEARRQTDASLMPTGLLQGAKDRDFADLYAYLRSL